jgi:hypothetical protein
LSFDIALHLSSNICAASSGRYSCKQVSILFMYGFIVQTIPRSCLLSHACFMSSIIFINVSVVLLVSQLFISNSFKYDSNGNTLAVLNCALCFISSTKRNIFWKQTGPHLRANALRTVFYASLFGGSKDFL